MAVTEVDLDVGVGGGSVSAGDGGTNFTCFTGSRVQIRTLHAAQRRSALCPRAMAVPTLLALLVLEYKH